jgi:endoglucanase
MREVVNKLDKDFVDTVRATGGKNKTRCLMIPTYAASATSAAMRALSIPDDPNVMVSIHAYNPYNFTMNTGNGATNVFDSRMENELKQLFTDINNIYLSKGKAVVIGEFSSSNKNNTSERVKWAKSYASMAKAKKIPIVLWDNNCPNDTRNNGEGHGYINRSTLKWYDTAEPVVDALIKTYGHVKASKEKTISNCKITLSQKYYTYDGNEHKPSVTVAFDGKTLTEGKDYSLTYKGGRDVGDASVTVTGIGNFKGSSTVKYSIDPANLSGYKLGDANLDGKLTISDITVTAAHVKGKVTLSPSRIKAADINRDGKVNITDITSIAAHVKGKKTLPDERVA